MEAVRETRKMNTLTFRVPAGGQTTFLKTMAKNMGWETVTVRKPRRKSGLEQAMEDVKAGRVYSFDNIDDAIKWLND